MANNLTDRLSHAWNAFKFNEKPQTNYYTDIGPSSSYRADKVMMSYGSQATIINSIYTRIAIDCSSIQIFESILNENGNVKERFKSGLTYALTCEANIDQTGKSLITDVVLSMFDEGVVAVVPVDTDIDPTKSNSYDIKTLRVGSIVDWYPEHVKINLYNQSTGLKEDILLPKKNVAIIENPFYTIMNSRNSTLSRLVRKISLLDRIDEQTGSGKMDLIIQLPYVIKSDARRQQAEQRRKDIEMQLANSKYGIAYTDGTEKITQLGHSLNNNLQEQVTYLTEQLYKQLGLTSQIFDGTANEQTMLNYYNHTIEPIMTAIADEFARKFLTKTARTQRHYVSYIRDPFKLVPVNNLAEIADKFTRNEILTSNEVRSIIGFAPSEQPEADELRNKNLNKSTEEIAQENIPNDGNKHYAPYYQNESENVVDDQTEQQSEDAEESIDTLNSEESLDVDDTYTRMDYKRNIKELDNIDEELDEIENLLDEDENDEDEIYHADRNKDGSLRGDVGRPRKNGNYANQYYDPEYAHEYYEAHKNSTSTAGLNTAGKEAAYFYKSKLDEARDSEIEKAKMKKDSQIENSNNIKKSSIKSSEDQKNSKISEINEKYTSDREKVSNDRKTKKTANAEQYKSNTEQSSAIKKANKEANANEYKSNSEKSLNVKNSEVERTNNAYTAAKESATAIKDSNIAKSKSQTKSRIDSYKKQMQNQIDSLQNQYSNLSTEQRKKIKDSYKAKIQKLRDDNSAVRESLNAAHSEYADSERSSYKKKVSDLTSKKKSSNEKSSNDHKSRVETFKMTKESKNKKADDTHTSNVTSYKAAKDKVNAQLDADYKTAVKDLSANKKANSESAREEHSRNREMANETHKTNRENYVKEYNETREALKTTYNEKYIDVLNTIKRNKKYLTKYNPDKK